ncbi:hypothetical protein PMG11_11323 [Penicillium brasilianum]|uniref:Zn(2)-C6 fungal-type domain-containing protein n=1 Tax=Penicillium brasilianum TaxID=104259 RepID=A0A0F7U1T7_PENBI|nr:hypothetical protein PMG11_11323 [Penicillium brasilianum]
MPPTRRSHRKSRHGCIQCKQRRVKCDEIFPCSNCVNRDMACVFETHPRTPSEVSNEKSSSSCPPELLREQSHRRSLAAVPYQQEVLRDIENNILAATHHSEWSGQDLEIMHHFIVCTAMTLSDSEDIQKVWQIVIPRIAYSFEFLMHGILCLSALHLAHVKPEKCSHYLTASRLHLSLGLRVFQQLLPSPNRDNCCALFAFCSTIMLYTYGSLQETGDTIDSSTVLDNVLTGFRLCRGTLTILPYLKLVEPHDLEPLLSPEYAPCFEEHF